MTIINAHVGYQLIKIDDGTVVTQWGPSVPPPEIPGLLSLPNGDIVGNPTLDFDYSGYMLVAWMDDFEPSVQSVFEAEVWILRFDAAEYADTHASTDNVIRRLWDFMLARGTIDVRSEAALAAKQHWIDEGLLSPQRADIIWDTVPSSLVATPSVARASEPKAKAKPKTKRPGKYG